MRPLKYEIWLFTEPYDVGEVADACGMHLNILRGTAVWSPRAQCDKALCVSECSDGCESSLNCGDSLLVLREGECVAVRVEEPGDLRASGRGPDAVGTLCDVGVAGEGQPFAA